MPDAPRAIAASVDGGEAAVPIGRPSTSSGTKSRPPRVLEAERDLLRVPGTSEADRMLALGGPDPGAEAQGAAATLSAAGVAGDPLVLTGSEADEARFKREAPGKTLLHVATHGVMLADTCGQQAAGFRGVGGLEPLKAPRRSRRSNARPPRAEAPADTALAPSPWLGRRVWLALADVHQALEARGYENEGMLTAEEVVTLDLRAADWVVLSACHSGAVVGWTEEGSLGMTRAFRLADWAAFFAWGD